MSPAAFWISFSACLVSYISSLSTRFEPKEAASVWGWW